MAKINNNGVVAVTEALSGKANDLVAVNTGETGYTLVDPSAVSGDGWDASSAPNLVTEAAYTKVGIGNDAPAQRLHIGDAADTTLQVIRIDNISAHAEIGVAGGGGDMLPTSAAGDLVISMESAKDILFGTNNNQRMIIDSAGNVGIGTNIDPPTSALQVVGDTIELKDTGVNSNPGIEIVNDARTWKLQVRGAQADSFFIRDTTAGVNRFGITSGGLVGIGVDDPDTTLEVFDTTTQLKLSYDDSNLSTFTVNSSGYLGVDASGNVYTFGDSIGSQSLIVDAGDDANADIYLNTDDHHLTIRAMGGYEQGVISIGDDCGRQLVLCTAALRGRDWDHTVQTNPTLYIHSATDPDGSGGADNDQWVSLAHDQTNAVIGVGKGVLVNEAALMSKGPHTHPDTFIKNTAAPTHGAGTTNNWLFVDANNYSNSQLTAPSTSANAVRLFKWQPGAAYTDAKSYAIVLPTLDATWSSSSNYLKYKIVIQQDTAMGSISGVNLKLAAAGGSDTINGSATHTIQSIGATAASAYDWTVDVVGYFDGSNTVWEVIQQAQWS